MSVQLTSTVHHDIDEQDNDERLQTGRSFNQNEYEQPQDEYDPYSDEEYDDQSLFHSATIVNSLPRSKALFHYVATPLLLTFFILIPLIIAIASYLSVVQVLICWVVASFASLFLYYFTWHRLSENEKQLALKQPMLFHHDLPHSDQQETQPVSLLGQCLLILTAVHNRWPHELYQFALTVLSCSVWIAYTYNLSYVVDVDAGPNQFDYQLAFSDQAFQVMIGIEYFLIVSFSLDYLIGLWASVNGWQFMFNYYRMIDLLCFVGVAYMSFTGHGFAAPQATYSYYLLQGFLRFLRLRRALSGLDAIAATSPNWNYERQLSHDYTFTLSIGPRQAQKIIVMFRIFLYLMSSAALILAVEFPCIDLADDPEKCTAGLQKFHMCIYFIVVTFSTVGYGDLACATTLGRMAVTFSIILAILQIPQELDEWNKVKQREEARIEQMTPRLAFTPSRQSDHQHHIPSQSQKSPHSGRKNRLSSAPVRQSRRESSVPMASLALTSPLHAWAVREIETRHSDAMINKLCVAAGLQEQGDVYLPSDTSESTIRLVMFLLGSPSSKLN